MLHMNESDARLKVLEKITAVLVDLMSEDEQATEEDLELAEAITDEIAESLDLDVVSISDGQVTLTVKLD